MVSGSIGDLVMRLDRLLWLPARPCAVALHICGYTAARRRSGQPFLRSHIGSAQSRAVLSFSRSQCASPLKLTGQSQGEMRQAQAAVRLACCRARHSKRNSGPFLRRSKQRLVNRRRPSTLLLTGCLNFDKTHIPLLSSLPPQVSDTTESRERRGATTWIPQS